MMRRVSKWLGILLLTMVMMLFACAGGKDFSYWSDNEVPREPGLFSGEDGYFTIYRKGDGKPADQQAEKNLYYRFSVNPYRFGRDEDRPQRPFHGHSHGPRLAKGRVRRQQPNGGGGIQPIKGKEALPVEFHIQGPGIGFKGEFFQALGLNPVQPRESGGFSDAGNDFSFENGMLFHNAGSRT